MYATDERRDARRSLSVTDDVDGARVRAAVRAMLEDHGNSLGECWDAQAAHAEEAVVEVIDLQGLEAGRRWAQSLETQLRAERDWVE